jgi:hypothetical protein
LGKECINGIKLQIAAALGSVTPKKVSNSGLPDGLFSNQKYKFGKLWMALQWKMLAYSISIL